MTAYYNEFDPFAAQWLRNLIDAKLIAPGIVDDRSITDVSASDLKGFAQCHFFAGIGGWSLALRLAGVPDTFNCWTGSPPCQPFSAAGKQLGQLDSRHLAPTFMRLVAECRPAVLFGEQVAPAIAKHWLDDLFTELEAEKYACGAAVLPACSVGAPHKRDRLFFGAVGNASYFSLDRGRNAGTRGRDEYSDDGSTGGMADADNARPQRRGGVSERADKQPTGAAGVGGGVADSNHDRQQSGSGRGRGGESSSTGHHAGRDGKDNAAYTHKGFWSDSDWIGCRDGKFRPVESGTFPLVNGVSGRVGRLRGYGNAIVPQVAAEFITAFMSAAGEATL